VEKGDGVYVARRFGAFDAPSEVFDLRLLHFHDKARAFLGIAQVRVSVEACAVGFVEAFALFAAADVHPFSVGPNGAGDGTFGTDRIVHLLIAAGLEVVIFVGEQE